MKKTLKPMYASKIIENHFVKDTPNAPSRPYGIPVDNAEFMTFLAAGNFTPDQVRTIRQMITQMEDAVTAGKATKVLTPTQEFESQAVIEAMKAAVESYPAEPVFNSFFKS